MISKELQATIGAAVREARTRRHEYLCVEHLLYALLDDAYGVEILENCGADVDVLRRQLDRFFAEQMETLPDKTGAALQQTAAFERLIQRAFVHVQYSGKEEVDAGDILASMFEETDSHAAYFLGEEGVTRLDVLNYVSHGVSKLDEPGTSPKEQEAGDETEPESKAKRSALEAFTVNLKQRAADGKIDPLIGREAELRRTLRVLARRRKNNPIFVG